MFDPPIQESPLTQCVIPAQSGDGRPCEVFLQELAFRVHLNLRGDPDNSRFVSIFEESIGVALPVQPNSVSRKQGLIVAWLGPDEWLLIAENDSDNVLQARLKTTLSDVHFALTDLSGGQTVISVSGERSLELLSKGCTLDLHPRVFGPSQCAQSQLAKANVLILPRASNLCAFDVIVRRSFADYLWRWLVKSGAEFGIASG